MAASAPGGEHAQLPQGSCANAPVARGNKALWVQHQGLIGTSFVCLHVGASAAAAVSRMHSHEQGLCCQRR